MQEYEKMGLFYLGRRYLPEERRITEDLVLYDSRDLLTHAVCVGMTGSGKTGLCVGILEEAAIDGIPAIIIDPKGDLANLLLRFPLLRGEDFTPWINPDDARRKGLSPEEFGARQAALWRDGLAEWGQDAGRIQRLINAVQTVVYTPGSDAGLPVSVFRSLAAPGLGIRQDREAFQERINTTVSGLLGLVGVDADPIRSREHILLSTVLHAAWSAGRDLDLPSLISSVQDPPVDGIGVLDLETFYPARDRFALVMTLNTLLAAPGFRVWSEGQSLDVDRLLYTREGRPRHAVFSIAHLDNAERMFFVSLLLGEISGWMRTQPGTTSLRAVLFMDEIFGYFPPVANPPSKPPLLRLLKEARAFGLGVVLATQNPVDLDYKGLSNTGTWFIGRLQTERDRERVLNGLESVTAGAGKVLDRRDMERLLSGLASRVFLMHNVHEDVPELFHTRWVLSYLAGPMTRTQIRSLMAGSRAAVAPAGPAARGPAVFTAGETHGEEPARAAPPAVPPDIRQFFVPMEGPRAPGWGVLYRPVIAAAARVAFRDRKAGLDASRDVFLLASLTEGPVPFDWGLAERVPLSVSDLDRSGLETAEYAALPAPALVPRNYAAWEKGLTAWLAETETMTLLRSPFLGRVSETGESERDFRIRLRQAARERRDEVLDRLRRKYASKIAGLQERIRRAESAVERETAQARGQHLQTVISFGATVLGALLGRKASGTSSLGRATTAARGIGRSIRERGDIARAEETAAALRQRLDAVQDELAEEIGLLEAEMDSESGVVDTLVFRPGKGAITVVLVALAWVPFRRETPGADPVPAWKRGV